MAAARASLAVAVGMLMCALAAGPALAGKPAPADEQHFGAPDLAQQLDGTRWQMTVVPNEESIKQGAETFRDLWVFKGEMLAMTEVGAKRGFESSMYTVAQSGDELSLITQQASDKEGVTMWIAQVQHDMMDGQMIWTKESGAQLHYRFTGQRLAAKRK